jgi:hypothetical protein
LNNNKKRFFSDSRCLYAGFSEFGQLLQVTHMMRRLFVDEYHNMRDQIS